MPQYPYPPNIIRSVLLNPESAWYFGEYNKLSIEEARSIYSYCQNKIQELLTLGFTPTDNLIYLYSFIGDLSGLRLSLLLFEEK